VAGDEGLDPGGRLVGGGVGERAVGDADRFAEVLVVRLVAGVVAARWRREDALVNRS